MSAQRNDEMSEFMLKQSGQSKEQKQGEEESNGEEDFLPSPEKPIKKNVEAPIRYNSSAEKVFRIIIMVPVIVIGIASLVFFVFKVLPPVVGFIRKVFILLLMGQR